MRNIVRLLPVLLAAVCFFSPTVWSQTGGTGALTGTINDASGAVIPNATVTLTSNQTGQARTATTNSAGSYRFALLPPGAYKLQISAAGFKGFTVPAVEVHIAETSNVDRVMEVGAVDQQIEVSGEVTEAIQTQTSTLGTLVNARQITELPLTTRNYMQIVSLSAGVIANVNSASNLAQGSPQLFVNGNSNTSNNFQMDGASANNFGSNTGSDNGTFYAQVAIPNPDAIQEFKVQTALYDAGSGRNPGANVEVVTKSGGNSIHGSAFEFFRNDKLNANSFFRKQSNMPRPIMKQNQFGFSLGGPVKKDKFFFFGSYQGTRQRNGLSQFSISNPFLPVQLFNFNRSLSAVSTAPGVPSPLAAALGAAFCNVTPNNSAARPGTGFYGGTAIKCDGSNINPVALKLLSAKLPNGEYYVPNPQLTSGSSTFSVPAPFTEDQFLTNLDYLISNRHSLAERFFWSRDPQALVIDCGALCLPGNPNLVHSGNMNEILKFTSTLSQNLVNEAKVGFTYNYWQHESQTPISPESLGITPLGTWLGYMPNISVAGLFTLGGASTDGGFSAPTTYILADQLSWTKGKHTIRAGFDGSHIRYTFNVKARGRGGLSFQSFNDLLLGLSAAQNGTAFSNVYATTFAYTIPDGGVHSNYRITDVAGFVTDDFRVSQRLTVNVGVRWEYFGGMSEVNGFVFNISRAALDTALIPPATGTFVGFDVASNYKGPWDVPAGVARRGTTYGQEHPMPRDQFEPRIGFAFRPTNSSRLVVHGGFGIFYQRLQGNLLWQPNGSLPPRSRAVGGSAAANALATFAVPFTNLQPLGFVVPRTPSSTFNVTYFADPFRNGRIMTYGANVQYEFLPSWVLDVGYVGNQGTDLTGDRADNVPALASVAKPIVNPVNGTLITTNTLANANQRVPYVGFVAMGLNELGPFGYSNYNSMQLAVRKQYSHGLQIQAAYTWGKALTNVVGTATTYETVGGTFSSNNPLDNRTLYGPAEFDRAQRLILSFNWDLPQYRKGNAFLAKMLGGWGVSGVTTLQTGTPLTFTDSRGGTAFAGSSRAQLCPGNTNANVATPGSVESRLGAYANISAFCAPPVVAVGGPGTTGTDWGNTSRGIIRGPGQNNSDFSVSKKTVVGGLREDARLDFRVEFFNAFNHPQFGNPATAVASPSTFGIINSTTVAPRLIQFGLKYVF
jgi:Carboxypeptidase regulatory-like domain